jgi:Bestrophin, RFP-TM, chloride channel
LIAAYPYLLRHHIRTGCLCEGDAVDERYRLKLEEPALQMVETRHEGDKNCGGSTLIAPCIKAVKECWVDRRNLPWSLLTSGALDKVARARNRPLWICDRLGREICDIPYGPNYSNRERQHFLSQVEKLTDAIGKCERIHQTAVPLNYARHSLRSLTIWLFTLPFCLVKDLGFMTGPAAAVIAWLFLGIYQIGYSIEDPFQGSLRLSILCDAIREDVMGTLDDDVDDDDNTELANQARNSAYQMEPVSWIDDVADQHLAPTLIPSQILAQYSSNANIPSPLFSTSGFKALQH